MAMPTRLSTFPHCSRLFWYSCSTCSFRRRQRNWL